MDPTIFGRYRLIWEWYNWGVFLGFVVALAAVFWVFFDSQRRGQESIFWKMAAVVSLILIIPSVILRIDPSLGFNVPGAILPLGYLGLIAGIAALVTLFAYSLGVGVRAERTCPTCGRPQHPSWEYCPYCVSSPASPAPAPSPPPRAAASPSTIPGSVLPLGVQATQPPIEPISARPHRSAGIPGPVPTEMLHYEPKRLAWLILRTGPRAGKEFPLGDVTNVGRDASQSDVVVDEPSVSRQHARIRLENERFVLYDLASPNKTFVNDEEIQKQPLLDGDTVRLGRAEFTFMEVK